MPGRIASVRRLEPDGAALHAWALDFPVDGKEPRLSERGLYLQGWVLEQAGAERGALLLRADGEIRTLAFNNERPDVIQRVLGVTPDAHPQKRCGVIAWLKDVPQKFEIGVTLDGVMHWLWQVTLFENIVSIAPDVPVRSPVIEGDDGWLFLDNDTNRSVDQYTGVLRLDASAIARWRAYLDQCAAIAADAGARHAIVFAASKEQVLSEHYPHAKGKLTVLEQVLRICESRHRVEDTAALLAVREDRDACFIKTDTHWTDRGARVAVLSLLQKLGLDVGPACAVFSNDVYYTMPFAGDLGVKMTPPASAPTEFLQTPPAAHGAVFDNQLANIGRVLAFETPGAPWQKDLLLFGASSSYPMLKYLKRLFRRIVFVHSAGNIDPAVIEHEHPDLLVMQTTARFMIEPPRVDFNLREAVASKLDKGRARGGAQLAPPLLQTHDGHYDFYLQMAGIDT